MNLANQWTDGFRAAPAVPRPRTTHKARCVPQPKDHPKLFHNKTLHPNRVQGDSRNVPYWQRAMIAGSLPAHPKAAILAGYGRLTTYEPAK